MFLLFPIAQINAKNHNMPVCFPSHLTHLLKYGLNVVVTAYSAGLTTSKSSVAPLGGEAPCILHEDVEDNPDFLPSAKALIVPTDVVISNANSLSDDLQPDAAFESPTHTLHVHFRSRVRIASGLSRHRHQKHPATENDPQDYFSFSPSSSVSGSPSSSISAPLRTPLDDEIGKPGWGTLGERVALFAKHKYPKGKTQEQEREAFAKSAGSRFNHHERTPLMNSSLRYLLQHDQHYLCQDEDVEAFLSKRIDQVFGPWPLRLFNHHVNTSTSLQSLRNMADVQLSGGSGNWNRFSAVGAPLNLTMKDLHEDQWFPLCADNM